VSVEYDRSSASGPSLCRAEGIAGVGGVEIQRAMGVLEIRDLDASIRFHRHLGLEVPDPISGRPLTVHRWVVASASF
jgi:hypothetical protein